MVRGSNAYIYESCHVSDDESTTNQSCLFTAFSYDYYTLKMLCIKNNFLYHFNDHDEGVDVDYHDHAEGADDFWRQEWNVCVE